MCNLIVRQLLNYRPTAVEIIQQLSDEYFLVYRNLKYSNAKDCHSRRK